MVVLGLHRQVVESKRRDVKLPVKCDPRAVTDCSRVFSCRRRIDRTGNDTGNQPPDRGRSGGQPPGTALTGPESRTEAGLIRSKNAIYQVLLVPFVRQIKVARAWRGRDNHRETLAETRICERAGRNHQTSGHFPRIIRKIRISSHDTTSTQSAEFVRKDSQAVEARALESNHGRLFG